MKFLVLAYGAEEGWVRLTPDEQNALLAQDDVLRGRGDFVAALEPSSTVVRAWDGTPDLTSGPFAASEVPLAGFGIIEARDLEEVVELVKDTPCARAGGAVEIRRLL